VVVRSEQFAVSTAVENGVDTGSVGREATQAKEKAGAKSIQKKEPSTSTVTVRVEGLTRESFSGSYGHISS
jgi:hypothetical protein